ncbi:hypothetical protein MEN41_08075 [Dolichospermum sp. ST_con]|nr:hypothetical protein [Dolichospermum sp. ST_con]MDD1418499.1 hypothetical protein [Dolichospermum sp. ST_sed1]MDD1425471.1 hypothetical protein [Dolichospermum sp. ST_sed9]MDD1432038.1 hypothetical protein [Dolichospermum sp. ST_sed6]MDD1441428.1 hypothetical protein [Dolichospermum sp. ST_sed3]MDD1447221.1 hypothetical protein [Dolichospermum sp. ST_sed8]MDD1455539.1 hypothetical protein [Dolichospermum sp. ST_sed7]MDD1461367.1 hypothetical protein [Dolichospermum sp. ST_sed2]MDD1467562
MPLVELMSQIQTLPKIDKLRLMQFLATELVKEEDANFFVANQEYPVWSPYNCSEAANILMNLLAQAGWLKLEINCDSVSADLSVR